MPTHIRWCPERKFEALHLYRTYGTPSEGVTLRELAQWDALDRLFPHAKLRLRTLTLRELRLVPETPMCGNSTHTPPLRGQRLRFYQVVEVMSRTEGICTYVDLSHALWGKKNIPASIDIFDVQACRVGKTLKAVPFPFVLKQEWGRGYRLQRK